MKIYLMLVPLLIISNVFAEAEITTEPPFTLHLSPNGTYLTTDMGGGWKNDDGSVIPENSGPATRLELLPPVRDVKAGDVIKLSAEGFLKYGPAQSDNERNVGAVFVGANGQYLSPFGLKRSTAAYPHYSPTTCTTNSLYTDISQDFYIPNGFIVDGELVGGAQVEVPEGAVALLIGVTDCFYADNSDPNFDFGALVQIQIIKSKYKIKQELFNGDTSLGDISSERIIPNEAYKYSDTSKLDSSKLNVKRRLKIKCFNEEDELQENCKISYELKIKESANGGHGSNHTSGRPLGKITLDGKPQNGNSISGYTVQKEGSILEYESPIISGEVELVLKAVDRENEKITEGIHNISFEVRIVEDLVPINIPGLVYEINSHPGDGFYLEASSHTTMSKIVNAFKLGISDPFLEDRLPMITLETEGTSLKWGGLFDINKNWQSGHKQHRAGDDIDLSMSVFNGLNPEEKENAQRALNQSITFYALGKPIYVKGEEPENYKDHWHVNLK